jgi:hypothetical protein
LVGEDKGLQLAANRLFANRCRYTGRLPRRPSLTANAPDNVITALVSKLAQALNFRVAVLCGLRRQRELRFHGHK